MTREQKLLPDGLPRWVRVYDEPSTMDRYTVVYTGHYRRNPREGYQYLGMSEDPRGYSQHGESEFSPIDTPDGKWAPAIGRKCHLGRRIPFAELPAECQALVLQDYRELWGLD